MANSARVLMNVPLPSFCRRRVTTSTTSCWHLTPPRIVALPRRRCPRRVANAWTQPDDLGVSSHDFLEGACVNCLYLPDGEQKNEDQLIAESFGVKDRLMQVRTLLHKNEGAPEGSA